MLMYAKNLELRGAERKVSEKSGKAYLKFHMEEENGNPISFICRDEAVLRPEFKKGTMVDCTFFYNQYGNISLVGMEVHK